MNLIKSGADQVQILVLTCGLQGLTIVSEHLFPCQKEMITVVVRIKPDNTKEINYSDIR